MQVSIAHAARQTGLSASAIRYYEEEGLLSVLPERRNGRRYYDGATIAELGLLNDLRKAGMSLAGLRSFQKLRQQNDGDCQQLSTLANERAKALRAEILVLRQAEERLSNFAQRCSRDCGESPAAACSTLQQLQT